jgi:lysyl-tRNA synthetase class 1
MGDMSSSGFIGFTPKRWLEIGEPEVMRYVYMFNTTSKRIMFDLSRVDTYHDHYDEAERLFFQDEDDARARAYELSQIREPPSALPFRLPYRHASLLSQVGPSEKLTEWAVKRLRDNGVLAKELNDSELECLAGRLLLSRNWARKHAPEELRVVILSDVGQILNQLAGEEIQALGGFGDSLSDIKWTEEQLKETMTQLTGSGDLPIATKQFFKSLYLVFLGTERGPRAAPFLAVLGRDFVLKRLQEASNWAANNK